MIHGLYWSWGPLAYPTQVLVAEQGAYGLLVPGRWHGWVAASAFGDKRATWRAPFPLSSPTRQVAPGGAAKPVGKANQRESWARGPDCTRNQGISQQIVVI